MQQKHQTILIAQMVNWHGTIIKAAVFQQVLEAAIVIAFIIPGK